MKRFFFIFILVCASLSMRAQTVSFISQYCRTGQFNEYSQSVVWEKSGNMYTYIAMKNSTYTYPTIEFRYPGATDVFTVTDMRQEYDVFTYTYLDCIRNGIDGYCILLTDLNNTLKKVTIVEPGGGVIEFSKITK